MALVQLTAFPSDTASLLVFCDLCSCSSVNDTSLPVLRKILVRASPLEDNINTIDILTDPETKSRRECLESQLFYKDNGGAMDDADPAAGANLGLFYRH